MMKRYLLLSLMFALVGGATALTAPVVAQYYGGVERDAVTLRGEQQAGPENVMIILDASGSMEAPMGGVPRMQIAKDTVMKTIRALPPNVRVGLRVYGHKRTAFGGGITFGSPFGPQFSSGGADCKQTEQLVPLGTDNRLTIASRLTDVEATGKTPITYSLQQSVMHDFTGVPGKKTIILVSDGRETCSYNPCEMAVDMVRQGVDIKINTVGYGTQDKVALDQLKCIALSTKGKFYTANTAADLARSLQDSMAVTTSVKAKITPGP